MRRLSVRHVAPAWWERRAFVGCVLGLALLLIAATNGAHDAYFSPAHQLTGIGAARSIMSEDLLAARTRLMIESQTFGILRDPRASAGAERILNPNLQKIFTQAEHASGWSAELLSAMAFLESFGDPLAQSPTGPRGIMQISSGTAKAMGLRVIYATKYRNATETVQTKGKNGKTVTKTVKRKIPYNVFVRDERLVPERAIPAAADLPGASGEPPRRSRLGDLRLSLRSRLRGAHAGPYRRRAGYQEADQRCQDVLRGESCLEPRFVPRD